MKTKQTNNCLSVFLQEKNISGDLESILATNADQYRDQHCNIDLLALDNNDEYTLLHDVIFSLLKDKPNDERLFVFNISQLISYFYGENEETLLHFLVRDQTIPVEVFRKIVDVCCDLGADLNVPDKNGKTAIELARELCSDDKLNVLTHKKEAKKVKKFICKDFGGGRCLVPIFCPDGKVIWRMDKKNNLPNRGLREANRSTKTPLLPLPDLLQSLENTNNELSAKITPVQQSMMA